MLDLTPLQCVSYSVEPADYATTADCFFQPGLTIYEASSVAAALTKGCLKEEHLPSEFKPYYSRTPAEITEMALPGRFLVVKIKYEIPRTSATVNLASTSPSELLKPY